jgi:hypothetical protein
MGVDTSIYNALGVRPKSMMDYESEFAQRDLQQQQRQQNALALQTGQMGLAEKRRAIQEQGVIRNALMGLGAGATDEQRINALKGTGLPGGFSQADALEKSLQERQKNAAATRSSDATATKSLVDATGDRLKQYRAQLDLIDSPQAAAQWLQSQFTDPLTRDTMAAMGNPQEAIARIPQDPQGFMQWRQQAAMGMEKHIQQKHAQAQLAETARGHDLTYKAAREGQAVTIRGQNMTDARGRELAEATREAAQATREDKKADKRTADVDKEVTKFANTIQKEGIPELETAVSQAEGAVGRYKPGEVPGVGPLKNALPAAVMSSDGKDVRQALAQVRNIVLSARSGAAVTDQELRRLVEEIGTGAGMTEDDMRKGLKKVRDRLEKIKENAAGGVSDDVLNTYTDRGGLPIKRGGTKPARTVTRTGKDASGRKVVQYSDGSIEHAD